MVVCAVTEDCGPEIAGFLTGPTTGKGPYVPEHHFYEKPRAPVHG
ncbi:hypothetical protein M2169_006011 [Streptomyces sp. MJP52]|nr:hypothetical protein [Streptomyces sp. MJP52]